MHCCEDEGESRTIHEALVCGCKILAKENMKGGGLLAEGGYGCVFSPGINCNGKTMVSKKYVSKIQKYDEEQYFEEKFFISSSDFWGT